MLTLKCMREKARIKDIQEKRLQEYAKRLLRLCTRALHSGMWGMEFDKNGNMCSVEWSPQFRRMIGFVDENDFPNTLEAWSDRLHQDDRDAVLKEYNATIKDYTNAKTYDVEYRFKVKSGQWRWFHAIGRILRREDGTPMSYVGMFVDITEKKTGRA